MHLLCMHAKQHSSLFVIFIVIFLDFMVKLMWWRVTLTLPLKSDEALLLVLTVIRFDENENCTQKITWDCLYSQFLRIKMTIGGYVQVRN